MLVLPVLTLSLFFIAYGHIPEESSIAVINGEICKGNQCEIFDRCSLDSLNCQFLKHLEDFSEFRVVSVSLF